MLTLLLAVFYLTNYIEFTESIAPVQLNHYNANHMLDVIIIVGTHDNKWTFEVVRASLDLSARVTLRVPFIVTAIGVWCFKR